MNQIARLVDVYAKYKRPCLHSIDGAHPKEFLIREDDLQVLHRFENVQQAQSYLENELFTSDVVGERGSLLAADPELRIYNAM